MSFCFAGTSSFLRKILNIVLSILLSSGPLSRTLKPRLRTSLVTRPGGSSWCLCRLCRFLLGSPGGRWSSRWFQRSRLHGLGKRYRRGLWSSRIRFLGLVCFHERTTKRVGTARGTCQCLSGVTHFVCVPVLRRRIGVNVTSGWVMAFWLLDFPKPP